MEIESLDIEGAWVFTPQQHGDARGVFLEVFQQPTISETIGHSFRLAQVNCSVSTRGTVRGVHFADVPPSQAKYITCTTGRVLDVIVDIRIGSPTFGSWTSVLLDDSERKAVYLSEGLGHGFAALEDNSTVMYLCSEGYSPAREHGVYPMDEDLNIDWGLARSEIELSEKDTAAPTLAAAAEEGLLPDYATCLEFRRSLADR